MMDESRNVAIPQWIGRSVRRVEDPRFLTGHGRYVGDLSTPGMVHVAFVRSPHAHARIVAIDVSLATDQEAVVTVVTGADLASRGIALHGTFDPPMPAMAHEVVRYVGEPVVAVIADDRYAAEDAAESVYIEYEELPAVVSADRAREGTVLVHPAEGTNIFSHSESWPEDLDRVFLSAPLVVEGTFRTQLQTAMPLEPRGLVADYDPGTASLVVHASTQMPHIYRELISQVFGLPQPRVRVIAPDVGGAFGVKLALYPEDVVVIDCAMQLGRPVTWISDRREGLLADCQSRGATYRAEAAFDLEGIWLGLRVRMVFPGGAYAAIPYSGGVAELFVGTVALPGPYKLRHYGYQGEVVYTNTAPTTTYRATGGPGAIWVTESLFDQAATQLGMDRAELRRRNMVKQDDFPYRSASGALLDPGSYVECLDEALRRIGSDVFESEVLSAPERGVHLGLGIACYVQQTAYGVAGEGVSPVLPYDPVTVRMEPTGEVSVFASIVSQGQGHATTLAQLVAEELRIDISKVCVVSGDTAVAPYGGGTHGSRSITVGGAAAILAARAVKAKILRIAAHLLEASPDDLDFSGDQIVVRGAATLSMTVAEVARHAYLIPQSLPEGESPGLEDTGRYVVPSPYTFTNGCHAVVVEISDDTGQVRILRYVVVQDCGTVVNPLVVEGQIRGGVAQGVGTALLERVAYDENGQNLTTTWLDYLMPSVVDVPPHVDVHSIETQSAHPGGMKGMGEAGLAASPAAIALAVEDALRGTGAKVRAFPITPEDVLAMLRVDAE